jgi:hypothetical protein
MSPIFVVVVVVVVAVIVVVAKDRFKLIKNQRAEEIIKLSIKQCIYFP